MASKYYIAPAWLPASGFLQSFPPSYLYLQYNDDPDLQALVSAYNQYAQEYVDAINGLNLPIYTTLPATTPSTPPNLLDWVGTNLYGIMRPVFSQLVDTIISGGEYNSVPYNTVEYNGEGLVNQYSYSVATDDQYQRVLTWNLYKGDGYQFTGRWLKRRVLRFLTGANGTDPGIDETYKISVTYGANRAITIGVDNSLPGIDILSQAIAGGFLQLPFQYTYSVVAT